MEEVPKLEPPERPLADIPDRERLGTLMKRYRLKAGKTLHEVAVATNIDEDMLGKVEAFELPLDANQLQNWAAFVGVQWHPLLDVVRDFHRGVWSGQGKRGGVQLESMDTKIASLSQPMDGDVERALIKASDDLLFMSNVCRETADRALASAVQVRALLSDRGVIPADAALELLDNPKVVCSACNVVLDRNREATVSFVPDGGGEALYFGSRECGDRWRSGEEFTCERTGLAIVQTSAPDDEPEADE